ncbi:hypothetical protein BXY80_0083 [Ichthyenterobacterium magnum]|uniref:Adhesin domain-containing protein n=2 Tax=Ichthyenterobacterium magnum TaxID=1230530 RepID=A0A420DV37_9FLAO|nr:hypothetical protein BXY80_0083 [Ichthyenterobacterium magnum]
MLLLCFSVSAIAQQKLNKLSKTINADKDVTIDLNTSYVQIEVDTWNKDKIEIEAYIESDKLSKEELKEALDDWNVNIEGSGDYVSIKSKGNRNGWSGFVINTTDGDYADVLRDLEIQLADMPELPEMPEIPELPMMPEMVQMPNMPDMPEMPEFPELPELPDGLHSINFDYDAYKKDGEKYLEKWSKEYEAKYGKELKDKMKEWGRKFGESDYQGKMEKWGEAYGKKFEGKWAKDMEAWGEKFGKQFGKEWEVKMEKWSQKMEKEWGKDYEKKMEAWGEKFEKEMEERSKALEERNEALEKRMEERVERQAQREEELAERMEERQERLEKRREELARSLEKRSGKVKRAIKIKMPKKAKLKMNVRHGELKFGSVIYNLKADISHSTLVANHIDGSETSINVSYSPVLITTWGLGELNLNYVDEAEIKTVNRMVLNSNSSNITIGNLTGNAIIDGSFGDFSIAKIDESFNNLNVILENSDALISLPNTTAYNFQYKGNRTRFSHPEKAANKSVSNFSTGNLSSNKTIVVNAKFSTVIMQ